MARRGAASREGLCGHSAQKAVVTSWAHCHVGFVITSKNSINMTQKGLTQKTEQHDGKQFTEQRACVHTHTHAHTYVRTHTHWRVFTKAGRRHGPAGMLGWSVSHGLWLRVLVHMVVAVSTPAALTGVTTSLPRPSPLHAEGDADAFVRVSPNALVLRLAFKADSPPLTAVLRSLWTLAVPGSGV